MMLLNSHINLIANLHVADEYSLQNSDMGRSHYNLQKEVAVTDKKIIFGNK
jgi:hypothetical protein